MKFSSHNRDMVTSRFPLAITLRLPTIDWVARDWREA